MHMFLAMIIENDASVRALPLKPLLLAEFHRGQQNTGYYGKESVDLKNHKIQRKKTDQTG